MDSQFKRLNDGYQMPECSTMPESRATLFYIHDPMCSWCWGFAPVWEQLKLQIQNNLRDELTIQSVLGGLAPDSDKPMAVDMQAGIRENWRRIQQEIPGIIFNYDFWTLCQPRRSTYPACRAVVACRLQQPGLEEKMIAEIQQAYYLHAKNPSDDDVLIKLAENIGLDDKLFSKDLNSEKCNKRFEDDLLLTRKLGVSSFPSLALVNNNNVINVPINYNNSEKTLLTIKQELGL